MPKPVDHSLVSVPDHTEPTSVATQCPYCALQCGMVLRRTSDRVSVAPRARSGHPGGLCQTGWTAAERLDSPERLTTPLIRDADGDLRPATWTQAVELVADVIGRTQRTHGRDAVAVLGGGGLTNEKAYALGKFARAVLRTPNIDYNGRFCMSSAAAANIRAFGIDRGLPFPQSDVAEADAILLVGGNVAETMPPFVRYLTARRERGGSLVVVDPRATPTARQATLHLQVTPGTDLALALGLTHIALTEGWADESYIAARTSG
ncbi:MAG TPA: molybdopterin-dependent oxidoreductase, partial [Actinopolymorphaceae bacterium]